MKLYLLFITLLCLPLQADTKNFKESYDELDNLTPTVLDLKIQKLDCLLHVPREFSETWLFKDGDEIVEYKASELVLNFGSCEKDSKSKRIIFSIHLPFSWGTWTTRYPKESDIPELQRHQIARNIFEDLILLAKKHIHESFSPADAVVFMNAPPCIDAPEELIIIFENGIPLYQDAFFNAEL